MNDHLFDHSAKMRPVITQCCMRHLYDAEPKDENLIEHVKGFERVRCGHHELEKPLSTFECLKSVVDPKSNRTNKYHYIIASQDDNLRYFMRSIPGVPLIYIKRSVMIMEPMASATNNVREKEERLKFSAGLTGRRNPSSGVKRMREDDGEEEGVVGQGVARPESRAGGSNGQDQAVGDEAGDEAAPSKKKRKKGPSGPNPLSVQKKVKTAGPRGLKVKARAEAAKVAAEEAERLGTSTTAGAGDASKIRRKRKHTTTSYGASVTA
jgi:U3 small nucleolar RNA-associated protein 23